MVHDCSLDSVEYRSGLCDPSVRPGTVWYLWMLYAVTLSGYFFLSYSSRKNSDLKKVIWRETPELVQWVEVIVGLVAWIFLGTYLGLAEGYEVVTLIIFFALQLVYIGLMFREAKKMKKGTGLEYDGPNLLAVLILSPMVLIVHLFLGGTYRVLMVLVLQNSIVNDLVLYSLGRRGLVHL